jgi:hypothetical protein
MILRDFLPISDESNERRDVRFWHKADIPDNQ